MAVNDSNSICLCIKNENILSPFSLIFITTAYGADPYSYAGDCANDIHILYNKTVVLISLAILLDSMLIMLSSTPFRTIFFFSETTV